MEKAFWVKEEIPQPTFYLLMGSEIYFETAGGSQQVAKLRNCDYDDMFYKIFSRTLSPCALKFGKTEIMKILLQKRMVRFTDPG